MTKVEERIRDKVVFLSGATGGLGRAMVERLAEEGAHLVLTDLDVAACQALVEELGGTPGRHLAARLDVADEAQWVEVAELIEREHGRLDGLVNNAGIGSLATVEEETVERWQAVMSVDSTGVWLGMKHLGPLIAASGGGSIVNLSLDPRHRRRARQQRGVRRREGRGPHADEERRPALGDVGRAGQLAAPGLHRDRPAARALRGHAAARGDAGEHPGRAARATGEEIAAVVAFLVSDDSTFMTGSEVYVDGGYTAR